MLDDLIQRRVRPVMSIRCREGHIPQARRSEPVGVPQTVAFSHPPDIARNRIKAPGASGTKLRECEIVKVEIGKEIAGMAVRTAEFVAEKVKAVLLLIREVSAPRQPQIVRAVKALPLGIHEIRKGDTYLDNTGLARPERLFKPVQIGRDPAHALGNDRPGRINPVMDRTCHFVFFRIARHLKLGGHGEKRLCRQYVGQSFGEPFLGRRIEPVTIDRRNAQATIVEHNLLCFGTNIPEPLRIARDALGDPIRAITGHTLRAHALPALANPEAQTITCPKLRMMTCGTGNILVPAQDRIVKKQLPQSGLDRVMGMKIVTAQRLGKDGCRKAKEKTMTDKTRQWHFQRPGKHMIGAAIALIFSLSQPAGAEIEKGRDLMEAGRYAEAMEEFWPAARSGNADAEELIGVMYALGLGVEKDERRAFEWYLRASLKGHPGAQSGIGWYYELGIGLTAPDLVRAYMWYTLSAIGGDPDAAISLEEVVKKMTPEQIEAAHELVDDYKVWLYPFR